MLYICPTEGTETVGNGQTLADRPPADCPPGRRRKPLFYRGLAVPIGTCRGLTGREAPGGFEPPMEVLQTSALPLGYGAGSRFEKEIVATRHAVGKVGFSLRWPEGIRRSSSAANRSESASPGTKRSGQGFAQALSDARCSVH